MDGSQDVAAERLTTALDPASQTEHYAELLAMLPAAVYTVDRSGVITSYNARAAELWGRSPVRGDPQERFCGSLRLFRPDGSPLPHDQCPMAQVLADGRPVKDREVVIERPDGTRIVALVNIVALRDESGAIAGAMNCFNDITARKQTENELRNRRQDLEDFFENCAVGLHWADADGTILRANRAELEMLGYRREEYVGRKITEFHDDPVAIAGILERLKRGEVLDKYPARLRAKDGSIRHVLITSNGRFRDGKLVHTRCFTLDVTAVRRAEKTVNEREQWLRQLIESLPAAVYTTDAAGRITFYNRAAVEFAGREPVLGSDQWCVSLRLYRPDGTPLPHDECPMAVALKENRPVRGVEAIAERPDGTRVPFLPLPTPLHDDSGALIGAVNMLVDITDSKRAEQYAQRLAAIVQSSDDSIISKSLDGIIETWNQGAERIFGYKAEEVIGKPVTILIPPDRHDEEPEILARIRRGERVDHYETVRQRKDGSLVHISLTVSPIRRADGTIIGASKISRDITAQKQSEERLKLLAREVDHRAKNILATVQALTRMTRADTVPAYMEALMGRLRALAQAHTLLAKSRWTGINLRRLIEEELEPFGSDGDGHLTIAGPDIVLSPEAGQGLGMALHELATNAAKYGAFSVPGGSVSVQWSTTDGRLVLRWIERDGPPVRAPGRRGFGSGLIEAAIRGQLDGEAIFDWHPAGLACELSISTEKLAII